MARTRSWARGVVADADVEERRERVERAGRDEAVVDWPSSEQVDAAETSVVHVARCSDAELGCGESTHPVWFSSTQLKWHFPRVGGGICSVPGNSGPTPLRNKLSPPMEMASSDAP